MAFSIWNTILQAPRYISTFATIPDSPKARLMYYLDSVCDLVELNSSDSANIRELTNYNRHWDLSEEQTEQLLVYCYLLSPDVLINKVIFLNDEMGWHSDNVFYDVGHVSNRFIYIGGQFRAVKEIMTFKMSRLRTYYFEPMQTLSSPQIALYDSCVIL